MSQLTISNLTHFDDIRAKTISFINPYSFYLLKRAKFEFNSIDLWHSDGFLLCLILKIFGMPATRHSFDYSSLAEPFFSWCARTNKSLAVVGSDEESIVFFANHLRNRHQLNDVTFRNGYFTDTQYEEYVSNLAAARPDIVLVGMGALKQEKLLIDLRSKGWSGLGFTCGGFIHQTRINKGNYYPPLIDKLNLRFAYRMWHEPATIKRYLIIYPISIVSFVKDILVGKVSFFSD